MPTNQKPPTIWRVRINFVFSERYDLVPVKGCAIPPDPPGARPPFWRTRCGGIALVGAIRRCGVSTDPNVSSVACGWPLHAPDPSPPSPTWLRFFLNRVRRVQYFFCPLAGPSDPYPPPPGRLPPPHRPGPSASSAAFERTRGRPPHCGHPRPSSHRPIRCGMLCFLSLFYHDVGFVSATHGSAGPK